MAILIDSNYGLKVDGFGGFNENGLKGYSFSFITYKKMNVDEARVLMVNVLEDILSATNQDLDKFGGNKLTIDNYEITLIFSNEKTKLSYSADQSLAMAMMINRKISYYERYTDQKGFKKIYHESYSDAYEEVFGKQWDEAAHPEKVYEGASLHCQYAGVRFEIGVLVRVYELYLFVFSYECFLLLQSVFL
ncbi:MAG: hypothetical protein ACK5MA_01440 [Parachlamydiaceae bacterium]